MTEHLESVLEAEREVYGPIAEAQSLISLSRVADGTHETDASVACLAVAILERFIDRWEAYHSAVVRHGRPSNADQERDRVMAECLVSSDEQ